MNDRFRTYGFEPVGHAARRLNLSPARVRQLIDAGVIEAVRLQNGERLPFSASVEAERQRRESTGGSGRP